MPIPGPTPDVLVRYLFGVESSAWAVRAGLDGVVRVADETAITVWDSRTGGAQHTDLLTEQGTPTDAVRARRGQYSFYGPSGVRWLWVDAGGGERELLVSPDALQDSADTLEETQVARDEAVAAAEAAEAVGATNDASVAAFLENPASQTRDKLAAAAVTQGRTGLLLDALTGNDAAVGNGTTDDAAALEAKLAQVAVYGGTLLIGRHRLSRALVVPAGATVLGRNDESGFVLPNGANFPALLVDGTSRARVENVRAITAGTTVVGACAVAVRGNATDVVLSGVRAEGLFDGFRFEGGLGSTPGTVKRVTLLACYAANSGQYGYRYDDTDGFDMIACRSVVSGLDAIKLRKKVINWNVNGGSFTGAIGGDGLDAYAGGGQFTLTGGAVFSGNTQNGVVVKTDDLSRDDAANYGHVRNVLIGPIVACSNGGSGVTVHRNNGDIDDTTEPLVQSVTISGLQAHDNGNYGLFVNARQVTVLGPHCRRNGLDGIRVQLGARDVDIFGPHVAGNSRTTPGARDGIWIAGLRVKVWGGSSIGADVDGAAGDAAIDAATPTQRYGVRVESTARGTFLAAVTTRANATGGVSDLAPDTMRIATDKPTGVPVTAAGVHAALVSLGLISS